MMFRKLVLATLAIALASCAPVATTGINHSKNPYQSQAARYETLSRIKVKPGETTYATVSYNPQYLDGDFSKVVEKNILQPEYPREGDVYAGQLTSMLDLLSVTPNQGINISLAYVEARREIGKVTVQDMGEYDYVRYRYEDSIEVTYKITLEKSEKYIPTMYFADLRNNYNGQKKKVMLMLDIEGQKTSMDDLVDDLLDDDAPEKPETPTKPETPENK